MDGIPYQKHYNLTHYQQRYNWDCGLSCLLMILGTTQRQEFLQNFNQICEEEGFGSSTWTIDLCYILKRFNVKHVYFTKTLGVDPKYSQHSYYKKIIDKDEMRVVEKFKDAESKGIFVEQKTVDIDVILKHLASEGTVILLTNASQLSCDICKKDILEKVGCSFLIQNKRKPKSYAGHYVVLCGFDLVRRKIYYQNPEVGDGHTCLCSIDSMDRARTAYGTDEDVIFIYN